MNQPSNFEKLQARYQDVHRELCGVRNNLVLALVHSTDERVVQELDRHAAAIAHVLDTMRSPL